MITQSHHGPFQPFSSRRKQRGVTVFIVMLTIVLLTGGGTWAMYSAGLTNQASGFSRAASQTLYTAELGLVAGGQYLSVPGYADANYTVAKNKQAQDQSDACFSAPDLVAADGSAPFCKSILMSDLNGNLNAPLLDQAGAEGSMGPFAPTDPAGIEGNFVLELSEPRPVSLPGEPFSGAYQKVTLTSYGFVRPSGGGAICGGAEYNAVATMMGMRAHMIIGPLTSQL